MQTSPSASPSRAKTLWFWFAILVLFNLVDFAATAMEVDGYGATVEGNPVMRSAIEAHGMWPVGIVKLLSLGALGVVLALLGGKKMRLPLKPIVVVLAVGFGVLALYHGTVLYRTGLL